MAAPKDREKALETALSQIDRHFGKGSVMRLGSEERAPHRRAQPDEDHRDLHQPAA